MTPEQTFIAVLLVGLFIYAGMAIRERIQRKKSLTAAKLRLELDFYDPEEGPLWKKSCPSRLNGKCVGHYSADGGPCPTFLCKGCGTWQPWCFGGTDDLRCDACVSK